MRIAVFSDNFYPEIGGVQDSINALMRELGARGHRVDAYVPQASPRDFAKARLPVREIDLGGNVAIHRLFSLPYPSPTQQSRMVIPTFLRFRALRQSPPDVIHTHSFFGVGLEALASARALRVPLVGTNHWAITEFGHYVPFGNIWFKPLSLAFISWYFNRAEYVTAPSQSVFPEMERYGFRKPHEAISNPIEVKNFRPATSAAIRRKWKEKFGLSEQTIVFAGRLGAEKKIDVVIRAIALVKEAFPRATFAVAGHGSGENDLRALARKLGVERQVIFTGTLTKELLAELFSASEIFAIMSTSETQSMVLVQAMACGLPAVGARARALPEYITPQTGYLVEPGDANALAERISFLLAHPRTAQKLGAHGRAVAQHFSVKEIVDAWERIYETALASYHKGRQ